MNDLDASSHSDQKGKLTNGIDTFIDNELQLLRSCLSFSNNDFEDYEAQAMFSATYILWITKVIDFLQHVWTFYNLVLK